MQLYRLLVITLIGIWCCIGNGCSPDPIADMGGSEVIGKIARADNSSPIVNLAVKAITIDSSNGKRDTTTAASTFTDSKGAFAFNFTSLPMKQYILYARYPGDSLVLPTTMFTPDPEKQVDLHTIKMVVPGAISGQVQWSGLIDKPILCYIPGTSYIATADPATGNFTMSFIPPGVYTVKVYVDGYEPYEINNIPVKSDSTTTLSTIIQLVIKTGGTPPTPQGLTIAYDSSNGVATLTWNKLQISDLKGYIVYSQFPLPSIPIADTVFHDTILAKALFSGSADTLPKQVSFQISAINNSNNESNHTEFKVIDATPSSWYDVSMILQKVTTPGTDTLVVALQFTSKKRVLNSIIWGIDPDSLLKKRTLSNVSSGTDTLKFVGNSAKKRIYVTVSDSTGWTKTDSIDANSLLPIDTWKPVDSLLDPRRYAGAAVLKGKIYVFGGASKEKSSMSGTPILTVLKTVEMYDTSTGKWTYAAPMNFPRMRAASAVLDGKLYVIGGISSTNNHLTIEKFDPDANTWTIIDTMEQQLVGAAACAYKGNIVITGGESGTKDSTILQNTVITYNPNNGSWQKGATLATARKQHRAVVIGDAILLIGGVGINEDGEEYPITTTECLFSTTEPVASLSIILDHGCFDLGVTKIADKLIVIGGMKGTYFEDSPLPNVDIISLADGSERSGTQMSFGCEGMAVVELNNRLFIIGGSCPDTSSSSRRKSSKVVYVYYP